MEILFGFLGLGSIVSILSLAYFVLTLKKQLKETKAKTQELYDMFFGKGLAVKYVLNDGTTQVLTIEQIREALGGRKDEAEVIGKRYAQNKLKIMLDLNALRWEECEKQMVLVAPQAQPQPKK